MLQEYKYKPIRYRWRELYKPYQFTYCLQVWLAILSFSLFICSSLIPPVWGWWLMLETLSPLQWIAFIFGSLGAVIFLLLSIWAFISLVILGIRGIFGIKIKCDPQEIPEPYRRGIVPVKPKRTKPKNNDNNGD